MQIKDTIDSPSTASIESPPAAGLRSNTATFAPSARSRSAAARPIPLAPPVTSAQRLEKS